MQRYGFPVPAGGVLTADSYRLFMSDSRLEAGRIQLETLSAGEVLAPDAVARLEAFRTAIAATSLPVAVAESIGQFLAGAGLADTPVAVRSSATSEDSAEASFAGMHQSFLNVRGVPAVLEAVKRCYASLWTPQAVAYRRQRGLSDEAVACAVVLCAMVTEPGTDRPVCAGVAFSCDPRTGRRDLITISAAPGLGEGVVGGSVNPEEIAVRKESGRYHLYERKGGSGPVLSDSQTLTLARLVDRVHWSLADDQGPQDVEWAHDGARFWLLQARPVTRVPVVTFPGAERYPIVWSNANLKDAVAGVQSPLSWSSIKYVISYVLHSNLPLSGYAVPNGLEVLRRFDGRAYFDLTAMMWSNYDAMGFMPAEYVRGLGGHQPLIPVPEGDPFKGAAGSRRRKGQLKFLVTVWRKAGSLPGVMADLKPQVRALLARIGPQASNPELLVVLQEAGDVTRAFGPWFQVANMFAGLWPAMMKQALGRVAPDRAPALISALLAGSGMVTSAEHGYRLFELAAAALHEPQAMAFLTREPLDPLGWRELPAGSPFRQGLETFLDEFGHRCVYEAELSNPRWREDPSYLLEQVRFLALAGKTEPPRQAARSTRATAEAELARLPWLSRGILRWMAAKARQGAGLREASKSALGSISEPVRAAFVEAGRRLAAAGVLDWPEDVFYLTAVELELYLRGEWDGTGARAQVEDRRARDAAWKQTEPPDSFVLDHAGNPAELPGQVPDLAPGKDRSVTHDGSALRGIGVAAGRAAGVARVIRHPSEGHLLQDGEVLVAPSTDPGWTPLFLRASAVVMEMGGFLSHGAIVAREYGLPAVVNLPGVLNLVKDGQQLVVDGDAGTVTLVGVRS